jgi:hypothetical protein
MTKTSLILPVLCALASGTAVHAADVTSSAMDAAKSQAQDQMIDQAVDTGADMAKDQLKGDSSASGLKSLTAHHLYLGPFRAHR